MQCPYCKEEIKDGAIKCKHCSSFLNDVSKDSTEKNEVTNRIEVRQKKDKINKTNKFKSETWWQIWGFIVIIAFIIRVFKHCSAK